MSDGTNTEVEQLYRSQHQRLWRSVLLFSGDVQIADDSVAEAFAQLLKRGDAVHAPGRWVWKAAFRIAAGELQQRSSSTTLPDDIAEIAQPEDLRVATALLGLSPHQRSSIILHYFAGYTYKEVAKIIGSTAAAVSVHVTRGRRKLRTPLEDDDAPE